MNHEASARGARRVFALVACGLLVGACSVGVGERASVPVGSADAAPAVASAPPGTPGKAASSPVPATVPGLAPAEPSASPTNTPTTPARSTARPSASTPPAAVEKPALASPAPAGSSASVTLQLGEPDNGKSIAVTVGSRVTLVLHNIYWHVLDSSNPTVLALVSGPVAAGAGPIACIPGTGCGTVTAVFRAASPGSATIAASRTACGEAAQCVGGAGSFEVTLVVGP